MSAIHLSPHDNIVVLARAVRAGEPIDVAGGRIRVQADLGLGHKVALRSIVRGEKILKYGVPIGSATRDIEAGAHVHLHNMRSDYLPTYTLEDGSRYRKT